MTAPHPNRPRVDLYDLGVLALASAFLVTGFVDQRTWLEVACAFLLLRGGIMLGKRAGALDAVHGRGGPPSDRPPPPSAGGASTGQRSGRAAPPDEGPPVSRSAELPPTSAVLGLAHLLRLRPPLVLAATVGVLAMILIAWGGR